MKIVASKEDMNKTGAYQIKNMFNGKFYVGGTSWNFKYRLKKHTGILDQNNHPTKNLQEDWNKYGTDAFEFYILEVASKEIIINVEQKWLDKLQPWINGYNTARKSMPTSGYLVGEQKEQWLNSLQSPEYREKRRELSRSYALKTARAISVYTKSGEYIKTFNNIDDLIKYSQNPNCDLPMILNKISKGKSLRREHINRVLCGIRSHMKGLIFKYAE